MNTVTPETLPEIVWQNHKVITTELLAQCYDTDTNNIRQNYTRNTNRFEEGKHFFKVEGDDLNNLRVTLSHSQNADEELQISSKVRTLTLWTEKGAVRHAKILDTDKAWEVQERLEEAYFHPERNANDEEAKFFMDEYLAARKLYRATKELSATQKLLIDSQQALLDYKDKICDEKIVAIQAEAKKDVYAATSKQYAAERVVNQHHDEACYWQRAYEDIERSKRPIGNSEAVDILRKLYLKGESTREVAKAHYRGVGAIRKVRANYHSYQLPDDVSLAIAAARAGVVYV